MFPSMAWKQGSRGPVPGLETKFQTQPLGAGSGAFCTAVCTVCTVLLSDCVYYDTRYILYMGGARKQGSVPTATVGGARKQGSVPAVRGQET